MANMQDETPPKVPATPARQGALGKPVMVVLLVSVTLAFVGLMAAWLFRADDLAEGDAHAGRQASDAALFEQDAPAPRIPEADGPAGPTTQPPPT
ncbi:hypothetical protein [Phenylobacterium sp.]|uniref:hypothetical protein n=1 Tax=Phenylobacterium sp. TaxID=1871053 RepID=UPI00273131DB|nr:hypothetical protein [Phenylobacterium sp.]MDP1875532.1 hypothetical protein [Phenylobacterium sp.]MDP3490435.1 hypothetical protein [Phenylobacterium sp.]